MTGSTGWQEQTKQGSSYIGPSGLAMGPWRFSPMWPPRYLQFIPSFEPHCWSLFYMLGAVIISLIVQYIVAPSFVHGR